MVGAVIGSRALRQYIRFFVLALAVYFWSNGNSTGAADGPGSTFASVRERARVLASTDYHAEVNSDLPDFLKTLTYDSYQQIRFREDHTLWNAESLRFAVQFFHRGYLYQDGVKIHTVEGGHVREVPFSPDNFDYGTNHFLNPVPASLGYAGFRLLYPLNLLQKRDEVAEFLGASYFRVLGMHQRYGASLRGLAIDTAEPSGEEFPRFTEFWIEKPPQLAGGIRVLALMDSPSVAGAYSFVIEPGPATIVEVEVSLFFRKSVHKVGIAPMSSLFLMGQNRTRFVPDFRPQVHDSDGLSICSGGTNWLWRPLVNPEKKHRVTKFQTTDLKGFGLLQRDRNFGDYQDLGARFELRPSYWIEPQDDWGPGTVELVEIPTVNDWNDNIVTYWVPSATPSPGQEMHFRYRISALTTDPSRSPLLRVRSTFLTAEHDGQPPRFVVDFTGEKPDGANPCAPGAAHVAVPHGDVRNLVVETNDVQDGFRVFFDLANAGDDDDQLRLWLKPGKATLGETWIYDYKK